MSRRTEIEVGVTVLVAVGVLLWGVTWLKDFQVQRSVKVWHVMFPQTGGLGPNDDVQINGIKKGTVQAMRLLGDGVMVDLAIASDVTLTRDSRVTIRNLGLMGEKVIGIDLRSTGAPWALEDTIPGGYEKGIPEVMGDVAITIESVTELSGRLAGLIEATDRKGDLTGTLKNMRGASAELEATIQETRASLKASLADFASTAKTTRSLTTDREAQLGQAIDHLASGAEKLDRLSGRLDSLRTVLQSVANKVDHGDGSLGRLINDRRLYTDVSATVDSLKSLIADIKKNPRKYIKLEIF